MSIILLDWFGSLESCKNQLATLNRIFGIFQLTAAAEGTSAKVGGGKEMGDAGRVKGGEVGGLVSLVGNETVDPAAAPFLFHHKLQPLLDLLPKSTSD